MSNQKPGCRHSVHLLASVVAFASAAACNAILGNKDKVLGHDAGDVIESGVGDDGANVTGDAADATLGASDGATDAGDGTIDVGGGTSMGDGADVAIDATVEADSAGQASDAPVEALLVDMGADVPATMMDGNPPGDSPSPIDAGLCLTPAVLPYPVDGNGAAQPAFISSNYSGDFCDVLMPGTAAPCPGHVGGGTVGKCWSVTLTTPAPTAPCPNLALVQGKGGVTWDYPVGNISDPTTLPGINMCGATKVTFWAAGATGAEVVNFFAGNTLYPPACMANCSARLPNQMLSTAWVQYTLTFAASVTDPNESVGFGWDAVESPGVGSTLKFMIDNIQWQ